MKHGIFLPALALCMIGIAGTQAVTLEIAEVNETLTATLDGSPFSIIVTGPQDHWTVQLPSGYSFDTGLVGSEFQLGEPESLLTYNDIFITQPTFLTWDSDLLAPGGAILVNPIFAFNSGTLPGGGTFDLLLADRKTVTSTPDGGSTFALCGVGIGILASVRSRFRR